MKKIVIVVAEGRVQSVFLSEELRDADVNVCDFDSLDEESELSELGDYVDACRETMKEVVC